MAPLDLPLRSVESTVLKQLMSQLISAIDRLDFLGSHAVGEQCHSGYCRAKTPPGGLINYPNFLPAGRAAERGRQSWGYLICI